MSSRAKYIQHQQRGRHGDARWISFPKKGNEEHMHTHFTQYKSIVCLTPRDLLCFASMLPSDLVAAHAAWPLLKENNINRTFLCTFKCSRINTPRKTKSQLKVIFCLIYCCVFVSWASLSVVMLRPVIQKLFLMFFLLAGNGYGYLFTQDFTN